MTLASESQGPATEWAQRGRDRCGSQRRQGPGCRPPLPPQESGQGSTGEGPRGTSCWSLPSPSPPSLEKVQVKTDTRIRVSLGGLVSWGCPDKGPPTGQLKQPESSLSVQETHVLSPGACKAGLPPRAPGEGSPASPSSWGLLQPRQSSALSFVTPVTASAVTWVFLEVCVPIAFPLCVCLGISSVL